MIAPIIEVENLTFRYDKRFREHTLSNISFSIQKGEWIAIIGQNGSGKSTLAQLLVGLLFPEKGSIDIDGMKVTKESIWKIRQNIGIVFQNPDNQFVGTTVQDDVAFALENRNMSYEEMKNRVEMAMEMVEIAGYHAHDPSRLSGGQKQRVAIAGILALKPSILVLDEAFVMLDPRSRRNLIHTLLQLKKSEELTIISITHDMNEAEIADRVLVMQQGEIMDTGKPSQIFSKYIDLEPPFAESVRRLLKERNQHVPDRYMTEKEMVQWLCR